jgi:hypothetical protein
LRSRGPSCACGIRGSRPGFAILAGARRVLRAPGPGHAGAGCRLGSQTSAYRCANRPVGSQIALHAAARWPLRPQAPAHACTKPPFRGQLVPDRCAERRKRPAPCLCREFPQLTRQSWPAFA